MPKQGLPPIKAVSPLPVGGDPGQFAQMPMSFMERANQSLGPSGLAFPAHLRQNLIFPEAGTSGFFGQHPAFTHGLENAIIAAAGTPPTPNVSSTGENISAAARGLMGITPARYQFAAMQMQLPFQIAEHMAQLDKTRAEAELARGKIPYYAQMPASRMMAAAVNAQARMQPQIGIDETGKEYVFHTKVDPETGGTSEELLPHLTPKLVREQREAGRHRAAMTPNAAMDEMAHLQQKYGGSPPPDSEDYGVWMANQNFLSQSTNRSVTIARAGAQARSDIAAAAPMPISQQQSKFFAAQKDIFDKHITSLQPKTSEYKSFIDKQQQAGKFEGLPDEATWKRQEHANRIGPAIQSWNEYLSSGNAYGGQVPWTPPGQTSNRQAAGAATTPFPAGPAEKPATKEGGISPSVKGGPSPKLKPIDAATMRQLYIDSGGDEAKARELAKERGYEVK